MKENRAQILIDTIRIKMGENLIYEKMEGINGCHMPDTYTIKINPTARYDCDTYVHEYVHRYRNLSDRKKIQTMIMI